jgi:hypothetical protein
MRFFVLRFGVIEWLRGGDFIERGLDWIGKWGWGGGVDGGDLEKNTEEEEREKRGVCMYVYIQQTAVQHLP